MILYYSHYNGFKRNKIQEKYYKAVKKHKENFIFFWHGFFMSRLRNYLTL